MRSPVVLHVTESFGGGVATAMHDYAVNTRGYEHHLAFTGRAGLPVAEALLKPFASTVELPRSRRAFGALRRAIDAVRPDIVHAHSSWAGVLVRASVAARKLPVVYTPHCYAFMREDVRSWVRGAFRLAETVMLANTSGVAACSPFEAAASVRRWSPARVAFVCNALPSEVSVRQSSGFSSEPTLVGLGRLSPQKDPAYFLAAFEACKASGIVSRARWIGDGAAHERRLLERAGVEVTGWLGRAEAVELLGEDGQVYLHSAAWEGFPVALLEAAALGTPTIVRGMRSLRGFEFPLQSQTPTDVPALVASLGTPAGWEGAVSGMEGVLARYDGHQQGIALEKLYDQVRRADRS